MAGSINVDDIKTSALCINSGSAIYVDLRQAKAEGDAIPTGTFDHRSGALVEHGAKFFFPEGITKIEAFSFSRSQVSEIEIPSSVTVLDSCAFLYSRLLTDLKIAEGLTVLASETFCGCSNLSSLTLPSTLKRIGYSAFAEDNLAVVIVPEGVEAIESRVFLYNPLQKIELPSTLLSIGALSLSTYSTSPIVICKAEVPPSIDQKYGPYTLPAELFDEKGLPSVLYVPIGTADLYRAASGWRDAPNIVELDFATGLAKLPAAVSPCRVSAGRGMIRLSAAAGTEVPIRIYGMDGRAVELSAGSYEVTVPAGVYLVCIGETVQRVLVK